jgi:hypothetical protein
LPDADDALAKAIDSDPKLTVSVEPAAPLDAVPAVLRLRLDLDGGPPPPPDAEPTRFVLVAGEVGSAHLGQLARNEISAALEERALPAARWCSHPPRS